MADVDVLRCGNCGAPVESGASRCRYCSYELVRPAAPAIPNAGAPTAAAPAPSRAERLGASIAPSLARVWSEGAAAWRQGAQNDAYYTFLAAIGCALSVSPGHAPEPVVSLIAAAGGGALREEEARAALGACKQLFEEEGVASCLKEAKPLLKKADLVDGAFRLAMATGLIVGQRESPALIAVVDALGVKEKKALAIRDELERA